MSLRPFFSYYGGKWRSAKHYPIPLHDAIIEPFAGAAGYSTRYPERSVTLVEKSPIIAAMWQFLIKASSSEIRSIPLIESGQKIADLNVIPEVATLIGMALNPGGASPKSKKGKPWTGADHAGQHKMNTWSSAFRERVASQVESIRHWRVIEGCYSTSPDAECTWFIDPPYRGKAGECYLEPASAIDYAHLSDFCRSRRGQVIVCEAQGADWLPFTPLDIKVKCAPTKNHGGRKYSAESIWTNQEKSNV